MEQRIKYPRTYHAPWSEGATDDDKTHNSLSMFIDRHVVISQKMDGENFTGYRNGCHARSLDGRHHPSRDWAKTFWAERSYLLPEGWRLCGENLYARHAIAYDALPTYLMGFSVWDHDNKCLSWDETLMVFEDLGIEPVPVEYIGPFSDGMAKMLFREVVKDGGEGIVIRSKEGFHYDNFAQNVAKAVRANHVAEGSERWETNWEPNALKG
jgi:hypothetical protein